MNNWTGRGKSVRERKVSGYSLIGLHARVTTRGGRAAAPKGPNAEGDSGGSMPGRLVFAQNSN